MVMFFDYNRGDQLLDHQNELGLMKMLQNAGKNNKKYVFKKGEKHCMENTLFCPFPN